MGTQRDQRILGAMERKARESSSPPERKPFAAKADEIRKRLADRPDLTQDGQTD